MDPRPHELVHGDMAFEAKFEEVKDLDPLELADQANLALHHHMAAAFVPFELTGEG